MEVIGANSMCNSKLVSTFLLVHQRFCRFNIDNSKFKGIYSPFQWPVNSAHPN